MRTPGSGKEAIMRSRDLPPDPSLEHLKNQGPVGEFHPKPAAASGESPGLAGFSLADAQLVIARQYGFPSWARLRRSISAVIRQVASPRELARAFELIGARRAPALGQDRYFLQLARRFPDDRPLTLVAEPDGQSSTDRALPGSAPSRASASSKMRRSGWRRRPRRTARRRPPGRIRRRRPAGPA